MPPVTRTCRRTTTLMAVLCLVSCGRSTPPPIELGAAGSFAVLAQLGLTVTPPGEITGSSGEASATEALGQMKEAFDEAARRPPDITGLDQGKLLPRTLVTSVYRWDSGLSVTEPLRFDGSERDVWILQIAGDLDVGTHVKVSLIGDPPLAGNIIWQVGGKVTLGEGVVFEGIVLSGGPITLKAGASLHGRALSQSSVLVDGGFVREP